MRAGRAADLGGKGSAADGRRTASRTPVSQPAALSPKVVGTACWVSVRATIGVSRCSSTRPASGSTCARRSTAEPRRRRRGATSISAVSSTSWLVRPRCSHARGVGVASPERVAQQRDQRHRRVAAGLGVRGEPRRSSSGVHQAGEVGRGAVRGATPASTSASSQAASTATIAAQEGRVRERGRRRARRPARSRSAMASVSRIGEEDGLALALEADVEDEALLVRRSATSGAGGPRRPATAAAGRRPASRRRRAGRPG